MERLTRKKVGKEDEKEFVLCNHKELNCDDSCQYGTCEWSRMALLRLKTYEDMHDKIEKRITDIKSSSDYPHNFKGQMVDDFEWVLSLLN